jgi:hypothetical protein
MSEEAVKATHEKGYDAAAVQPLPTGNGVDVAVIAAERLRGLGQVKIAEDIEARIRLGERKYGTRLKSHNGRDAWLDAYQESLDCINYAQQVQTEGLDSGELFGRAVELAIYIEDKMRIR